MIKLLGKIDIDNCIMGAIVSRIIASIGIELNNIVLRYYHGYFPVKDLQVIVGGHIPLFGGMPYYWLADIVKIPLGYSHINNLPMYIWLSIGDLFILIGESSFCVVLGIIIISVIYNTNKKPQIYF